MGGGAGVRARGRAHVTVMGGLCAPRPYPHPDTPPARSPDFRAALLHEVAVRVAAAAA